MIIQYLCKEKDQNNEIQGIVLQIQRCRQNEICPWMRPDAKVQVTVEYKREGSSFVPLRIHNVLISQQHDEKITHSEIQAELQKHVLKFVLPEQYVDQQVNKLFKY